MAELKIPSLQHLARNWRNDAKLIRRSLVTLAKNPPIFNYNPLFLAIRDLLLLNQPYEEVARGIRDHVKRDAVRSNYLSVLPLIRDHFGGASPDFYQSVERRYYPVGRGLMVPFEPPMIYGVGGQLYFPWFSFWRSNPLEKERMALFVTLVDEILLDDPDLEGAKFEILDFSVPKAETDRALRVVDAGEIPRLSEERKREMLEIFMDGFFQAQEELRRGIADKPQEQEHVDPRQPSMFD